jgi:hypothetical protein
MTDDERRDLQAILTGERQLPKLTMLSRTSVLLALHRLVEPTPPATALPVVEER